MRKASEGGNRVHQKGMLARMRDIILPPGNTTALGRLKRDDYLRVAGEMKGSGLIKEIPPYGEMYADCTSRK